MNRILGVLAASACVVASSSAAAQTAEGREGLYGRLNLNAGYMSLSSDGDNATTSIGTGFSLAAGHSVLPNLFLFGEFNYDFALSPSVKVNGQDFDADDLSMSFLSVGPGVAYYMGDIFLTGMVGYQSVSTGVGNFSASASGFGLKVGAGHQWEMSPEFSLGLGANVGFGSVKADGADSSATALNFGLALSGVYGG